MRTFDVHETEEMDDAERSTSDLPRALRELEALNRRFGGHRYLRMFLKKRLRPGLNYRILDVATGGGDFPRTMVDWGRRHGVNLVVDALDANPETIKLARGFSSDYPEIRYIAADILDYAPTRFYDLVHCSLSMHHFGTEEAVEVLKHCRELSREHVLITDLERSLFTRLGVALAGAAFGHSGMARRDGATSARRAFTYREFRLLAKGAGWTHFGHERFLLCRQALWLPR